MNAELSDQVRAWCLKPTDFWNFGTVTQLVRHEWDSIRLRFSWDQDDYTTAGYLLNNPQLYASKWLIPLQAKEYKIFLEAPNSNELHKFYMENGLILIDRNDLDSIDAVEKLDDAFKFLDVYPGLVDCITRLVRVIELLEAPSPDIDVSYSHPDLPFSIFLSVCEERSTIASVRIAESILHEAMHLRLSLMQKLVSFFNLCSIDQAQYFAPWRQEERPTNGVLHGIFVFRAILEFFKRLLSHTKQDDLVDYCELRIKEISFHLKQVSDFYKSPELNSTGKEFVRQLLNI